MMDDQQPSQEPGLWGSSSNPEPAEPNESQSDSKESSSPHTSDDELWNESFSSDQEEDALLRPRSAESLLRLREQVEAAADELVRLRKENAALRERLEAIENSLPGEPSDGTLFMLNDEPEKARRKVQHFISAIDRYLSRTETRL